jgi:SEC-C motif-containing protein
MESDCPCGSGTKYAACCAQLHNGAATAQTALELMRSRYSAFAVGNAGYLLETWYPATRPMSVDLNPAVQWRRLQIRDLSGGADGDKAGTVEFVAHYWDSVLREYGRQHENSRFVREGRRWFYVEPAS